MAKVVSILNPDIQKDVPDHLYASYLSTKEWKPYKEPRKQHIPDPEENKEKPLSHKEKTSQKR